jgi:hypothetical protein
LIIKDKDGIGGLGYVAYAVLSGKNISFIITAGVVHEHAGTQLGACDEKAYR